MHPDLEPRLCWLTREEADAARALSRMEVLPERREALERIAWAYECGTSHDRIVAKRANYSGPERRRSLMGEAA